VSLSIKKELWHRKSEAGGTNYCLCVTSLPRRHYVCSNKTIVFNEAWAIVQNEFGKYDNS